MFNLMSNCCTWISKIQEPIRKVIVLVVGLDKAGKTSSIKGMLRVAPGTDVGPTQGCVRTELRVENYLVTLLEIGGAPQWRRVWRDHYRDVHGIIFVVDSSDRPRIKEVKELLADLLKHPQVAGKPILVLANKQDKMNALLGSELIEILSLERLVNQSRSLCHIEPCSALMDLRRWSDRKTLRGLRWLLRAVCLDYPDLCARIALDSRGPLISEETQKRGKSMKDHRKSKEERKRSSKSELRQSHRTQDREKRSNAGDKLPIQNILQKEHTLKKKLKRRTKKRTKIKVNEMDKDVVENEQEQEEGEGHGGEREQLQGQKEKASSALIPPKRGKVKCKAATVKTVDVPEEEAPDNEEKASKAKGEKKKKKKVVKVKRKNKITTEEVPPGYTQPVDLSATFDLYRKAILALKERQDQGQ